MAPAARHGSIIGWCVTDRSLNLYGVGQRAVHQNMEDISARQASVSQRGSGPALIFGIVVAVDDLQWRVNCHLQRVVSSICCQDRSAGCVDPTPCQHCGGDASSVIVGALAVFG